MIFLQFIVTRSPLSTRIIARTKDGINSIVTERIEEEEVEK